ncbi:MAG: efflux RND transporter periplasmic adaptor subunit [Rhodobacteraceae bacterium]|nr:efflux RND transporter periplasmic adaptor subunit [Paracoccaceae bacterium]
MRLIPVITAILVAAVLYGIVIERDRLLSFARETDLASLLPGGDPDAAPDAEADAKVANDDMDSEQDTAPAADDGVKVIAMRSVAQVVDSAVVLRGETEADRTVKVMAETGGKVISTPLRRGAFVEAGQMLCEIDPGTRSATLKEAQARLADAKAQMAGAEARVPEAQARVQEAKARLEEAQINANAASKLKEDGFASETRVAATEAAVRGAEAAVSSAEAGVKAAKAGLDSVQANIESAEAAVVRAQTDIDRLRINAPFAGVLETDTAELGSLMQTQGGNALCATILQLDPIKLVAYVPETEVNRVELGARAGGRLVDGTQLLGKVSFVSRSSDPTTRTFRVEILIDNPGLKVRDGQTAEIGIEAEGAPAHLLPQSALTLNDEGALGVRTVAADSTALFVPVSLLRDTRDGVWLAGLPQEADVIVVGQEYVRDGVAVVPSFEELTQ